MSEVLEVEDFGTLLDLIETEDTLVVKFWATWCVPCRQFAPHFESASEKSEATFVAVDVDKVPDVVLEYSVLSVPAVKMWRKGQFVTDLAQTPPERTVIKLLNQINNV